MNKERSEQLKIALLGVIALLLIIKTVEISSSDAVVVSDQENHPQAFVNENGGITVRGANPSQPAQQVGAIQDIKQAREVTTMSFDQVIGDLGTVSINQNKTFTYTVTNTGQIPLVFEQITGDPGVTIVSQPTAPIAPGAKGAITAQLNLEAGVGQMTKTIHVGMNTEPAHMHLSLAAVVR